MCNEASETLDSSPFTEQEKTALYQTLSKLWQRREQDPIAPPLSEVYALIQFNGAEEPIVAARGKLLKLQQLKAQLTQEAIDVICTVPEEAETFMVVIDHPGGIGVYRIPYRVVEHCLCALQIKPDLFDEQPDVSQKDKDFGGYILANLGGIAEYVDKLCSEHLARFGTMPTGNHVAAICLTDQDMMLGSIMLRSELQQIGSAAAQERFKQCLDTSPVEPGKLLTVLVSQEHLVTFDATLKEIAAPSITADTH